MKDKAIAFLTLSVVFSLFLFYKINPNETSNGIAVKDNNLESFSIIELDKGDDKEVLGEMENDKVNAEENSCIYNQNEIDNLTFSEAFKYSRNCIGENMIFSWNGNEYKTVLKSELEKEIHIVDSNNSVDLKADKEHMQLQNEMFGVEQ